MEFALPGRKLGKVQQARQSQSNSALLPRARAVRLSSCPSALKARPPSSSFIKPSEARADNNPNRGIINPKLHSSLHILASSKVDGTELVVLWNT